MSALTRQIEALLFLAPEPLDLRHMRAPRVTVGERLQLLRNLLRRDRFDFEEAVRGEDRLTVAMTVYALLELYKRGEAGWEQAEPFGPITVARSAAVAPAAAGEVAA